MKKLLIVSLLLCSIAFSANLKAQITTISPTNTYNYQNQEPISNRITLAGRVSLNWNDYADNYLLRESIGSLGAAIGYNKNNLLFEGGLEFRPVVSQRLV